MDDRKGRYAKKTNARKLADVIGGSDVFLGLSAPRVITPEMLKEMAPNPLILALANPTPEIMPELAKEARPDAIIATGRSDYPNQVNNVLCFPFIFRGALDVGATTINEAMKIACVRALADLAKAEASDIVAAAYGDQAMEFGPENLIPKPFDPRLILELAPAVARAAMESGVATRPITDWDAYRQQLTQFVFRSGLTMRPVFARAKEDPKRVVYSEGEEERVLRAAQVAIDEELARPIIVGRREVVSRRVERLGLRIRPDKDFTLVDPDDDPRYSEYWREYYTLMERRGVTQALARNSVRTNTTLIGALLLRKGEADALICGPTGQYDTHLKQILDVIGLKPDAISASALSCLILPKGTYFLCDTYVNPDPSPDEICEMTLRAADQIRRFGLEPKAALISHSSFGTHDDPQASKMRGALARIMRRAPDLEIEGEMHADAAVSEQIRNLIFPSSRLKGQANLLVFPNLDSANIAFNLVKVLGDGLAVGPLLLGVAQPAHIVTPSVTVRGIVNVTALATVDAQVAGAEARDVRVMDAPVL
jgi:malate dehydrogenase (oxaloacetate-decarboxylating)(NADP+)